MELDIILKILQDINYSHSEICVIYLTGSRLYGSFVSDSDWDYTIVVTSYNDIKEWSGSKEDKRIDLSILSVDEMEKSLEIHNLQRLTNIWSVPLLGNKDFPFKLGLFFVEEISFRNFQQMST